MTRGHVSACPDLNTANSTVQQKILALLKDCIDCGVDGFRFDAAKHIETESDGSVYSSFWANTLDQAKTYYKGKTGKDLFAVARTSNKSAPELQDLLTGSRLVHMAAADMVNRYAENLVGRSGYSQLGVVAAASTASCLRNLRAAYKSVFMLLDGYDYPNANAKNCSNAFDKLGHGAAAIAGVSIAAAWQEEPANEREFVRLAVEAANRMKKNLLRYITIL
jgi:hypothetical protein